MIHYRSAVGLQQEKLRQAAAVARPRRAGQRSNPLGRLAGILTQLLASRATAGPAPGDELIATSGIDDG
jgi:hypothetical protein